MNIKEITTTFKNRAVLDDNGSLTTMGRRAIIALSTALNHGYEIKSRFSVVPDPNTTVQYQIWQAPIGSRLKYKHCDWLKTAPKPSEYVPVYEGCIEKQPNTDVKQTIFDLFNTDCPNDFHGMAVATSDVICLMGVDGKVEWWYVDGEGFVELKWNI